MIMDGPNPKTMRFPVETRLGAKGLRLVHHVFVEQPGDLRFSQADKAVRTSAVRKSSTSIDTGRK
ncbi:hypothetical protein D5400_11555 [Georhizobium profundi]|uniref:Uncharacterized protein n=1 Tax=Georhizobium profundi TaxID=2341112 RepID=A0A3S9B4G1_9HYPH|nr:hypothetical protein D5400_11555 [Georhizobium profundi]